MSKGTFAAASTAVVIATACIGEVRFVRRATELDEIATKAMRAAQEAAGRGDLAAVERAEAEAEEALSLLMALSERGLASSGERRPAAPSLPV